jgi:hypothetical protein
MDRTVKNSGVISGPRTRIAALALVALALAVALWGYREYQKRTLHAAVVALVTDTSVRLREVVSLSTDASGADAAEAARRLDEQAGEIDRRLEELRRINAAPNRALVDAAELYIVTARELARRMASSHRHRVAFQHSATALRELVQSVNRRSGSWIEETLRARERAERDYFSYRLAVDAAAKLLGALPEARHQLEAHVDPSLLLEETLRAKGEEQAREAARRAADELEQAKRLASRR